MRAYYRCFPRLVFVRREIEDMQRVMDQKQDTHFEAAAGTRFGICGACCCVADHIENEWAAIKSHQDGSEE